MRTCVTCGAELHPERAKKYDYCMSPECQKKNLKGLTMVAVGVNKAAEQYLLLDEDTMAELASGKYHDQRRGSFGTSLPSPGADPAPGTGSPSGTSPSPGTGQPGTTLSPDGAGQAAGRARTRPQASQPRPAQPRASRPGTSRPGAAAKARQPWTDKQARLAVLYNEQGLRPEEIAQKLGLSSYAVTQIILTARNRGKL